MEFEYKETPEDLQTRIDIHRMYGERDIDAWMLDLLKPTRGARILDVGCGAGKQLKAFYVALEGDAELVGGDVSSELLARARSLRDEIGADFDLRELDFDRPFPFPGGDFDIESCCFAVYYARDPAFTVGEMHRVLRDGGQLFLTGPMPENKRLFYDVIQAATGAAIPPMPGSSRFGTIILDKVKEIFASVELSVFENPLSFTHVGPFLAYTRASLSEDRMLWKGLFRSAGEFERVMERIERAASARLEADGELRMTKVVGGILARK
jgi:SAM-dependent methyltransferase